MGDIDGLARSIASVGLLHPVVVTPDGTLIAGGRRMAACRTLGWSEIPVTEVDLDEIATGELAENVERKDFTPLEIDAIRRKLAAIETAAAKARQGARTDLGDTSAKVSHKSPERAVDRIGAFAGVSGRQVEKIARVADAAERDPERFAPVAAEMDRTGSVDAAYREVIKAEKAAALEAARAAHQAALDKAAHADVVWDEWLNCVPEDSLASVLGCEPEQIAEWLAQRQSNPSHLAPPASRQHFDIWSFHRADGDSGYFGKMPPQVVENLLWFYTKPGDIVVDPFAGGGTTIDVCKAMGRRVWASDRKPSTPTLPIHQHDIVTGWPANAPNKADLILLDPPYWRQAEGRYSDDPADLGNMTLEDFNAAWAGIVATCKAHLTETGRIAYIIGATRKGGNVDHATDMLRACWAAGFTIERRIIVPYQTACANGQQVTWARENKRLLEMYRDLVVLAAVAP
jgi:ParB/RepB/Spo0J family partition protein